MYLVRDLPEIFEEFGEKRRNAFLEIKEYKDRGIPVVGMYCAYFPTELAIAVGAIPVGLCSFSNETVPAAEKVLPKSMCPLVKSSYGFAIEDKCPFFHFSDLVIGETTCDGKKKMYEMMAEFKPVFVMELPNSQSESGFLFWQKEVIRTKEYFEEYFHVVITDKMIRDAVHVNNEIRRSLKNLCEVMKLDPAPVLGEDIQKMVTGSKYRFDFHTTPQVVDAVTAKILEEYKNGRMLEKRPRILVTGCPIGGDSMKVIHEIERNGGVVVAVENCSGVKTLDQMVDESQEDIYKAIANRYLSTGCSIMTPNDNRIELLGRIIDEYRVDGVVEMILTGCHATGAESVYIRKFVNDEKGLPYLAIDTDYSRSDIAQIATRLTAFLEMIEVEKGGESAFDINDCYKEALQGLAASRPVEDVLNKIYEIAHVPFQIVDEKKAVNWIMGATEDELQENILERTLPHKRGCIRVARKEGVRTGKLEELLGVLEKYYELANRSRTENPQQEYAEGDPDFLWILADDETDLWALRREILAEQTESVLTFPPESGRMFVADVKGMTARDALIDVCRGFMQERNGKLLIGNGFSERRSQWKNLEISREVFKLARKKDRYQKVYLTEQYYRELAISYISRNMEEDSLYKDELAKVRRDDEKTGGHLYETLYWFLRMRRSMSQTAAKLKIHRNTLLPRITRINELIGLDEKDGMECLKLSIAMEIGRCQRETAANQK